MPNKAATRLANPLSSPSSPCPLDAAKAFEGHHQTAHEITFVLDRLGVIKIVRRGQARANGGKATEFRYLLLKTANGSFQNKDNRSVESPAQEPPF